MLNVKSDEPTENYFLTLKVPSALWAVFSIFQLIVSGFTDATFIVSSHNRKLR